MKYIFSECQFNDFNFFLDKYLYLLKTLNCKNRYYTNVLNVTIKYYYQKWQKRQNPTIKC